MSDILINELRVTSYKLSSLRVAFIGRVTSNQLHLSLEIGFATCLIWVNDYTQELKIIYNDIKKS